MKKFVSLLLALAMGLSLAACGTPAETTTAAPETTAAETTAAPETTPAETEPAAAYTAGTYTGTAVGHNGNVTVEVTVSDNVIESIVVVESAESNGIGNVAADHVIADVLERQSLNIDAVSGCTISRAAFVSAITSALEAAGADVAALANVPVEEVVGEAFTIDADVVVIGSGAAGLSAAIEAAEDGAKVVILEKLPRDGGATRTSSAMLVVGGSQLQEAAGIKDNVQNLKDYWIQRGEGNIDEEMTNYVADHANEALEWLIDMGVNYAGGMILFSGTADITRAHMPALSGVEMMDRMVETAKEAGVEIYLETPATSLIQDASGAIVGVMAEQNGAEVTVNAKAVVIATGGY
ncbi:MAG: FAD-dependent oxidoreductase, partial [Lachnospiraceae bacterium]|nr:FAD-dependent oxidoreductase [Lachnospiraceae bacterium]